MQGKLQANPAAANGLNIFHSEVIPVICRRLFTPDRRARVRAAARWLPRARTSRAYYSYNVARRAQTSRFNE